RDRVRGGPGVGPCPAGRRLVGVLGFGVADATGDLPAVHRVAVPDEAERDDQLARALDGDAVGRHVHVRVHVWPGEAAGTGPVQSVHAGGVPVRPLGRVRHHRPTSTSTGWASASTAISVAAMADVGTPAVVVRTNSRSARRCRWSSDRSPRSTRSAAWRARSRYRSGALMPSPPNQPAGPTARAS